MENQEKISKKQLEYAMFSDFNKIEKTFEPSDEELKIIVEQTSSTEAEAREYFNKNKGDLEAAIFDYLESNDILKKIERPNVISDEQLLEEDISSYDKIAKCRDILYHKDLIFQKKFDEKSITGREINKFEYIPFNNKTTKFCKINFKGSKEFFSTDVIQPYLENEITEAELYENSLGKRSKPKSGIELETKDMEFGIDKDYKGDEETPKEAVKEEAVKEEEVKEEAVKEEAVKEEAVKEETPKEEVKEAVKEEAVKEEEVDIEKTQKKVILKAISKKGLVMAKKWGLQKPIIAFMELSEDQKTEENINKLATKFMRNSEYFNETQNVYGPAIMIDNWIM